MRRSVIASTSNLRGALTPAQRLDLEHGHGAAVDRLRARLAKRDDADVAVSIIGFEE